MAFQASALCVKATANMRSGPGTKYPVTWTVPRYTPLKELRRKGAWIRVSDQDGAKHWIHRRLVEVSSRCVAVRPRAANLRRGPGVEFGKALFSLANRYMAFRSLGGEDGWIQVQDEFGGRYWIARNLVWRPVSYQKVNF